MWVLLAAFLAVCCSAQVQEPLVIDMNKINKASPVSGEDKTRLLKVDYAFETESVMYHDIENKGDTPSTLIAGNFTFETLHYDLEGSILARLSLTVCKSGPCGEVKPIYVGFLQGGNNLEAVFTTAEENEQAQWNILYAIANTIYTPAESGAGDEQFVATVYGNCRIHFTRPEDKKFIRKINNCDLIGKNGFNYTRFDGMEISEYSQEVLYRQNAKVDADIAIIEAVEMFKVASPFDRRWGYQAESRLHVEITNRTKLFVDRNCGSDVLIEKCALEKFGARRVGKKTYENVQLVKKQDNKFSQLIDTYRNHLFDMGDSHTCEKHSSLFAEIVREAREVEEQEWIAVIKNPENEPILHTLANVLGSLGSVESLRIAREHLFVEGAEFLDDYLFGAANAIGNNEKWHKQMMYWLSESKDNEDVYWRIANTIATILRRRCERTTSSLNACNKDKERIVTKFISDISNCTSDICHQLALETLVNLPVAGSYHLATTYLCGEHSSAIRTAALKVIKEVSSGLYEVKMVPVLVKIFRNVCPQFSSTGQSQLATDILVKCIPDHQSAATLILRTETNNPEDPEKWQYFYKAVLASGIEDELKAEFWNRMRQFKVFRPNYAQRALKADSGVHFEEIEDLSGFRIQEKSAVEFDAGLFKRSEFELKMKKGKKYHGLFGVSVSSSGLESFVRESTSPVPLDPEASIRLSLLGHSLPTVTLFKGASGLMDSVWNADGQTIKAFEGNVVLRDFSSSFPLLSGMTIEMNSNSAASLKILGSCEISLWNKDSFTNVKANVSISHSTTVSLHNHNEMVHQLESSLSLLSVIGSSTEASFADFPPQFCMQLGRENSQYSLTLTEQIGQEKKRSVLKKKTIPGVTFKQDQSLTDQCNYLRHSQNL